MNWTESELKRASRGRARKTEDFLLNESFAKARIRRGKESISPIAISLPPDKINVRNAPFHTKFLSSSFPSSPPIPNPTNNRTRDLNIEPNTLRNRQNRSSCPKPDMAKSKSTSRKQRDTDSEMEAKRLKLLSQPNWAQIHLLSDPKPSNVGRRAMDVDTRNVLECQQPKRKRQFFERVSSDTAPYLPIHPKRNARDSEEQSIRINIGHQSTGYSSQVIQSPTAYTMFTNGDQVSKIVAAPSSSLLMLESSPHFTSSSLPKIREACHRTKRKYSGVHGFTTLRKQSKTRKKSRVSPSQLITSSPQNHDPDVTDTVGSSSSGPFLDDSSASVRLHHPVPCRQYRTAILDSEQMSSDAMNSMVVQVGRPQRRRRHHAPDLPPTFFNIRDDMHREARLLSTRPPTTSPKSKSASSDAIDSMRVQVERPTSPVSTSMVVRNDAWMDFVAAAIPAREARSRPSTRREDDNDAENIWKAFVFGSSES